MNYQEAINFIENSHKFGMRLGLENSYKLLELLDKLDEQGTRWALSNNLKYDNPFLDEWKDKYKIHYLNGDYVNCNYHKIDRSKDVEVLITNY